MEILQSKIPTDLSLLKKFINKTTARELDALAESCYYPRTKKFYFELLNLLKIKESDIKEYIRRIYKGTKAEIGFQVIKDPGAVLLVFIMHQFLRKRDQSAFLSTMIYYMIVQYAHLMYKQMKYCNADTFRHTLDTLTKTHLFSREKTISGSLHYLALEMIKNFSGDLKTFDIERIIAFMLVSRHRVSQSVKSFAEHYYAYRASGIGIQAQTEPGEDDVNKYQIQTQAHGEGIVNKILTKIITVKEVDIKALEEAKEITKVKTSIATLIAEHLSDSIHLNNLKIALHLFVQDLGTTSDLCGERFYDYIKKLMAVKRSSNPHFFKNQINILLVEILKDIKQYKVYETYTNQTRFSVNSFLAYYLALIVRNTLC